MLTPDTEAARYIDADKGVADSKAALDGARQILMEGFAEDAQLLGELRERLHDDGIVVSTMVDGEEGRCRFPQAIFRLFRSHQGYPIAPRTRAVPWSQRRHAAASP